MFCSGDREKGPVALEEQWDYINLSDFKSESCWSGFSYFLIYVFLLVSVAVYGVDTFTAVNLLAFSRWAGSIEPAIPFKVSRWIFAVCIIVSFALLIYRWLRAIRAMRSGSIAHSYLDSLAVRIQSIRMGQNGRGWRRFLVFAELTKSRKGAEYVALFAYFSFESWMSTIFADGPRQVVNAITLYSVMQMDLLPGGSNTDSTDGSTASQLFHNIKVLAEDNTRQAIVLVGMIFTLVIWVLSMLKLLLAVVLYLLFLWHHIPTEDGSLKRYCKRKINSRLTQIVRKKVNKALAKGVALQDRKPTQPNIGIDRKPTLPTVGMHDDDKTPIVTTISRSTTQTTLPAYSSRPGTAAPDRKPTLPDLSTFDDKPPALSRTVTQSSFSDAASMSGSTAVSTYSPLDRHGTPAPPVPPLPQQGPAPMPLSQTPRPRQNFNQAPPAQGYGEPIGPRSQTPMSRSTRTPAPQQQAPAMPRSHTPMSRQDFTPPPPAPGYRGMDRASPAPPMPRIQTPMSRSHYTPAPPSAMPDHSHMPYATHQQDPGEGYNPFANQEAYYSQSSTPFRSCSPATGPNARALTPGAIRSPVEDMPNQPFSCANQLSDTPYPVGDHEYPGRSFTPAGPGNTRSPPPINPAETWETRTTTPIGAGTANTYTAFSPADRSSPMPLAGNIASGHNGDNGGYGQHEDDLALGAIDPVDTHQTIHDQNTGYVAFNPSANINSPLDDHHSHDEHFDHRDEHHDEDHDEPHAIDHLDRASPAGSHEAAHNAADYIAFNPSATESHQDSDNRHLSEHEPYGHEHQHDQGHEHIYNYYAGQPPATAMGAMSPIRSTSHEGYTAFNPFEESHAAVSDPKHERQHHDSHLGPPQPENDMPKTVPPEHGYVAFSPVTHAVSSTEAYSPATAHSTAQMFAPTTTHAMSSPAEAYAPTTQPPPAVHAYSPAPYPSASQPIERAYSPSVQPYRPNQQHPF
ncbi:uncharacterized protein BO72DRAFT_500350 [Aspergillus fijiensis CBS 313.89]|uniref:Pheromone-regulated membrane protein n=1 Tax=Aspergillus fijiensis CBS 313.89 TaxID=1448319 RepID=A0A8G1VVE0_9EURO|nr:uncharacterized protein BO72DRAFT_500350 [Aspergillus fijiensis CBS 313.89]RAK73066.1 hypothetical protein BO72DRAFT_500350 [Aspergillus fijiensis CBS 313.89]